MPIPLGVNMMNFDRPYDIVGRTATELNTQIGTLGPARDGRRYSGELSWSLRYRYGTMSTMGGCGVRDVRVSIETITTMPHWTNADSADAELRAQWAAYLTALRTHEEGHRRIALEAANAVRQRLDGMRGADCQSFAAEAQFHFERLIREYNKRNADYDASTRHGFTQGAIWPPRPVGPPVAPRDVPLPQR